MPLPLADRLELEELMHRYAWAMDIEHTEEEFLELFTPDAVLKSPISGYHEGTEGLKKFALNARTLGKDVLMRHFITNFIAEGTPEKARIRAYFILMKTPRQPERPRPNRETEFVFAGGYDCEAVKVDGKWRLKRRIVTVDAHS